MVTTSFILYHQTGTITMETFLALLDKAVIKQKMEEKQLAAQ